MSEENLRQNSYVQNLLGKIGEEKKHVGIKKRNGRLYTILERYNWYITAAYWTVP
jgi:hypothetical protein